MVCKKCGNEGVLSNAGLVTSMPFWYCRTCKIEIELEVSTKRVKFAPDEMTPAQELQKFLDDLDEALKDHDEILKKL